MTATNAEGLERMCGENADASSGDHHAHWATRAFNTCLPKPRHSLASSLRRRQEYMVLFLSKCICWEERQSNEDTQNQSTAAQAHR